MVLKQADAITQHTAKMSNIKTENAVIGINTDPAAQALTQVERSLRAYVASVVPQLDIGSQTQGADNVPLQFAQLIEQAVVDYRIGCDVFSADAKMPSVLYNRYVLS